MSAHKTSSMVRFFHATWSKYSPRKLQTSFYAPFLSFSFTATPFKDAQTAVSDLINNRILVGHALKNDLRVLMLTHPRRLIRDTSSYKPFRKLYNGRTPGLKNLARDVLQAEIQTGEHSPVRMQTAN